jgi:predicted lipoprotein with Yx(FWY)xxD motif
MKRSLSLLPLALVAVLAVAGCGSSNNSNSSSNASSTATPTPAKTAQAATTIDVHKTDLGRVLVDSQGRTLYLFEADKNGKSACSGGCATAWPPLTTTGAAVAGTGAAKKLIGTTKRADGSTQATYNGWPLYLYEGDSANGQTNGEGLDQFGAEWYVLSPSGKKVEKEGS